MDEEQRDAPRLRDLGDERRPVAGTSDFTRVGDVGDLPYAKETESEAEGSTRNLVPLVAMVAVVAALVIGIGLAFLL